MPTVRATNPRSVVVRRGSGAVSPTGTDVWCAAGKMVVDRHPLPAMVVDSTDRIRAVNRLLARDPALSGDELVGRLWTEVWPLDRETTKTVFDALARARDGGPTHVTLSVPTARGDTAVTYVELASLGPPPDGVVIVSVLSTRVAPRAAGVPAAVGVHYEVETPSWRLVRVSAAEGDLPRAQGRCFEVLHGRSEPCETCPVAMLAEPDAVTASCVTQESSHRLCLNVVNARRMRPGLAAVSSWPVDDRLMSLLISKKVDLLAKRAGLSERERGVLDMLLLGRSHPEIAAVLGITVRTVKYHQGRMQTKLGVDSRLDLLRVVL